MVSVMPVSTWVYLRHRPINAMASTGCRVPPMANWADMNTRVTTMLWEKEFPTTLPARLSHSSFRFARNHSWLAVVSSE